MAPESKSRQSRVGWMRRVDGDIVVGKTNSAPSTGPLIPISLG